jgi:hypothetical protein
MLLKSLIIAGFSVNDGAESVAKIAFVRGVVFALAFNPTSPPTRKLSTRETHNI